MLRFLLDGQVLDEIPEGWDDLETGVKVDRQLLNLRLVTVDTRLTWYRDGYRYLRARWLGGDGCQQVELRIQEDPHDLGAWQDIYRGFVKLAAAQWTYEPDRVEAPVEDASWYAFLSNNKGIEVPFNLGQTKNGQPLTGLVAVDVDFFQVANPGSGTYTTTRPAYLLGEILTYVVAYLSDNEVEVRSDVLAPGGAYWNYCLQTGYRLATGLVDQGTPSLTLQELLIQLNRNFNLGAQLELGGGAPVLRVEPVDFFYQAAPQLQLEEVHPLQVNVDTARLYASVKVGSDVTDDSLGVLFPERTRWHGFYPEQYYLLGQCNVDAELDLSRSWVVSSNVIEAVAINGSTSYDDDLFLVELNPNAPPYQAHAAAYLGGTVYYYNEHLTNEYVVERWLQGIPSTLASELGNIPNATFQARRVGLPLQVIHTGAGTTDTIFTPLGFDNDYTAPGYDNGNVYGNGTAPGFPVSEPNSRYTVPAAGIYSLSSGIRINYYNVGGPGSTVTLRLTYGLRRYDSANTLLEDTSTVQDITMPRVSGMAACDSSTGAGFLQEYRSRANWVLNAGDYVTVYLRLESLQGPPCFPLPAPDIRNTTYNFYFAYFTCTQTSNNWGDFTKTVDADAQRNVLLKFRAPLTRPELRGLLGNLSGAVDVHTNGRRWRGWLESLRYDHASNLADLTLLTSKNLLPK